MTELIDLTPTPGGEVNEPWLPGHPVKRGLNSDGESPSASRFTWWTNGRIR